MTKGRYGIHGGQYVPETLMNAVLELQEAYEHYINDPQFKEELKAQGCHFDDERVIRIVNDEVHA